MLEKNEIGLFARLKKAVDSETAEKTTTESFGVSRRTSQAGRGVDRKQRFGLSPRVTSANTSLFLAPMMPQPRNERAGMIAHERSIRSLLNDR